MSFFFFFQWAIPFFHTKLAKCSRREVTVHESLEHDRNRDARTPIARYVVGVPQWRSSRDF